MTDSSERTPTRRKPAVTVTIREESRNLSESALTAKGQHKKLSRLISDLLDTWLMSGADPSILERHDRPLLLWPEEVPVLNQIPVIGSVAAGIPLLAESNHDDLINCPEWVAHGADFALNVQGDSMEPLISDGDRVVVRKAQTARNGDIVVTQMEDEDGEPRGYVKYLRREGGVMSLQSESPKYPSIPVGRGAQIVGKVIRAVRYLDRNDLTPARIWATGPDIRLPEPGSAGDVADIFAEAAEMRKDEDPSEPPSEYSTPRPPIYTKPIRPEFPNAMNTPHEPWLRNPNKRQPTPAPTDASEEPPLSESASRLITLPDDDEEPAIDKGGGGKEG